MSTENPAGKRQAVVKFSKARANQSQSPRSFTERWKHEELFEKGYIAVPALFLRWYAHLQPFPLSSGEALFVLHLMEFKWDTEDPYPGYKTLATRMGISDKMARRHAQSLETKKYLVRKIRTGQTNRFDLSPLFDALLKAVKKGQRKTRRKRQAIHVG